jgi:hypothetical protein
MKARKAFEDESRRQRSANEKEWTCKIPFAKNVSF